MSIYGQNQQAERNRRRESALSLVSQGKGFSDVVTAQMSQWGCSRSSAQRDCRWAHDQLQLGIDSHDAQPRLPHGDKPSTHLLRLRRTSNTPRIGAQRCSTSFCWRWTTKLRKPGVLVRVIATATPGPNPTPYLGPSAANRCGSSGARCLSRQRNFLKAHLVL